MREWVLCAACEAVFPVFDLALVGARRTDAVAVNRLRVPHCARCGARIGTADPLDALLSKLVQLARFGLVAESGPLLMPSRRER